METFLLTMGAVLEGEEAEEARLLPPGRGLLLLPTVEGTLREDLGLETAPPLLPMLPTDCLLLGVVCC